MTHSCHAWQLYSVLLKDAGENFHRKNVGGNPASCQRISAKPPSNSSNHDTKSLCTESCTANHQLQLHMKLKIENRSPTRAIITFTLVGPAGKFTASACSAAPPGMQRNMDILICRFIFLDSVALLQANIVTCFLEMKPPPILHWQCLHEFGQKSVESYTNTTVAPLHNHHCCTDSSRPLPQVSCHLAHLLTTNVA